MTAVNYYFELNGQVWNGAQLERLEYERNLHILHQMKQHGIEIMADGKELSDEDIDYLSMSEAWKVSTETRSRYSGNEIVEKYGDSLKRSDEMWKNLGFDLDKPMKVSKCVMKVEGISLQEYMELFKIMQADEKIGLTAHPEHFMSVVTEDSVIGIEPFGMYGAPTMVQVQICSPDKLGKQIMNDLKADYPVKVAGFSTLTYKKTLVNSPVHQFKPTKNGFEAILAVYWPEHTILAGITVCIDLSIRCGNGHDHNRIRSFF